MHSTTIARLIHLTGYEGLPSAHTPLNDSKGKKPASSLRGYPSSSNRNPRTMTAMGSFTLQKQLALLQSQITLPQRRAYTIVGLSVLVFMLLTTVFTFHNVDLQSYAPPIRTAQQQPLSARNGVAVIIETSVTPRLIPVSLHFASVLGPAWPVIIYTLKANWRMPASVAFRRALETGAIEIRYLSPDLTFPDHHSVSVWLTSPWLWEQLQDENRVLMFQTDSIICANSARTIDDFAEWDFIGAPIDPIYGLGYNGGLSLRNPRKLLQIARSHHHVFVNESRQADQLPENKYEDQWFNKMLKQMGGHLPNPETAGGFAVETVYFKDPLGYHQVERFHAPKMEEILAHCPEVSMVNYSQRLPKDNP